MAIIGEEEDLEMPDLTPLGAFDWENGVEEYQKIPDDELWVRLGTKEHAIPYFNPMIDRLGMRNPADDEDFFSVESGDRVPLVLRWHQLVGILKGLHQAFDGKPLLLMDEVGFGKTIQVVGIIAMLAWYHEFYEQTGNFPGIFSKIHLHSLYY
jgi:hypothetical protein